MWQLLLAAAVAGSGIFARRLFYTNGDSVEDSSREQIRRRVRVSKSESTKVLMPRNGGEYKGLSSDGHEPNKGDDSIFRFASKRSSSQQEMRSDVQKTRKAKLNVGRVRKGVEVQKIEKSSSFCLKKRKTGKCASAKYRHRNSKDDSSFSWGVGVGIMYMMSTGKAEISRLNKTVDETTKAVQELKSEIYKRKSSHGIQFSSSKPSEPESIIENRFPDDMKHSVLPLISNDDYECGSSALTDEPVVPEIISEIDKLEAELESELQKLPGCFTGECYHDESGGEETSGSQRFNGVSPSEFDQKLCRLVMKQQETQILELESDLHSSQSKLRLKEAELESLKECVNRLSHCSLHVSDDEVEDGNGDWSCNNNKKVGLNCSSLLVGMKRAIEDDDSCIFDVR